MSMFLVGVTHPVSRSLPSSASKHFRVSWSVDFQSGHGLTSCTALRKSAENIVSLVDIMGKRSKMPCFSAGVEQVTSTLRQRFQLQLSQDAAEQFVETDLVGKSLGSYYTRL